MLRSRTNPPSIFTNNLIVLSESNINEIVMK